MAEVEVIITVSIDGRGVTENGKHATGTTWRHLQNGGDNPRFYPNLLRAAIKQAAENALAYVPPDYDPDAKACKP